MAEHEHRGDPADEAVRIVPYDSDWPVRFEAEHRLAARALAEKGYSLRETATLLGLSHQRVDQLLAVDFVFQRSNVWAVELGSYVHSTSAEKRPDVDVLLVVRNAAEHGERWVPHGEEPDAQLRDKVGALLAVYVSGASDVLPTRQESLG
jgi:hypothetical protein